MTRAAVAVRRARESDIDVVVRIEQASFADPWSRTSFESALDLERMCFLVAAADNQRGPNGTEESSVVGFVVALLLIDEAEIADIAVVPEARGKGIGGQLLDRMMAEAGEMGVRSLYLEVRESNGAARALYESRSFAHVGRRRGYYRHPAEDALIMRCDLAVR